jgi:hypothetical protein
MGDGVDGPHRHRLCQNEVVADLKQRGPSVRAHVKSRRDDRGATREAQPPGPDERVATPEYFAGRAEAAVVGDRLEGSIGGMVESNGLEALDLVAER